MNERFILKPTLRYIFITMMVIGVSAITVGFFTDAGRTWANYLLNNFYFLQLAVGASFFIGIQYIAQAGWSSGFKRIPEAMMMYMPYAAILFLFLYFGIHDLYHWSHEGASDADAILLHKAPYLNIPFFTVRLVVYFALWVLMVYLIRKTSLKEDEFGGLDYFHRSEHYSKVMIFIYALTFTLAGVDWIMSIDTHWYSTIFPLKNFVSAFFHGSAMVTLIVLLLNKYGYLKFLNESHLHDFARYVFILAIIWGYFWFSQFMLIWYGNIPEETVYYAIRMKPEWSILFWSEIIINWAVPFVILMPRATSRSKTVLIIITSLLIVGQWIDLYMQIMPGTQETSNIGFTEIGMFIGFWGLFGFVVAKNLAAAKLVPEKHPYIEECLEHHF